MTLKVKIQNLIQNFASVMVKPKDHTDPAYQVVWSTQLELIILQTPTQGFKKNLQFSVAKKSLKHQTKNELC